MLSVSRYSDDGVKTFTVSVPSLQRLLLLDDGGHKPFVYVINGLSLKYLKIEGFVGFESCLIENAHELVEADINISSIIYMGSFTSARRLSLKSTKHIAYSAGTIFYQLVCLKVDLYDASWWNLLTLFLCGSLRLQVLEITDMHCCNELDPEDNQEWNEPKDVPECLLLHLETLVWKNYRGQTEMEKDVVKFILGSFEKGNFLESRRH